MVSASILSKIHQEQTQLLGISIRHIFLDLWIIYKEKKSISDRYKTALQILPESIRCIFHNNSRIHICLKPPNRLILQYLIPILPIKLIKIGISQKDSRPNKLKARHFLEINILMITDKLYFLQSYFLMQIRSNFDVSFWYEFLQTEINNINYYQAMDEAISSVQGKSFRSKRLSKNGSNRYQQSSLNSDENEFLFRENPNLSFATIDQTPQRKIKNHSATISLDQRVMNFKKKGMIEQLSDKNQMLRRQVQRVEKILNSGERNSHKKQKFQPQMKDEVIRQQLSNAYKQIRIYENQIQQRKKLFQHEGTFVDKIRKAELTLMQRQDMVKRLEAELSETKKQSNQFIKLLQDGNIQKQYANKVSRLHKEIKFYENMLKEQAELDMSDKNNMHQKVGFIKKMEDELISGGFSKVELTILRKQFQAERTTTSQVTVKQKPSQDRSRAAFQAVKNQIAILKKMQKDYSKKTQVLQKQVQQATEKSKATRQNLDTTEKQIEKLQTEYARIKGSIDPAKLKPLFKNGSGPNESTFSQFGGKQGGGNPLEHVYPVMEAGYLNKKGTIFNDRFAIGKKSAKIIELVLYENRTQFLGFQATYLVGSTQKKGFVNVLKRENERFLKNRTVRLQAGDYFKSFQCAMSKDNIITGITLSSFNGTIVKVGFLQGMKMQLGMAENQYPCCIYGCYSEKGVQLIGVEKVQAS